MKKIIFTVLLSLSSILLQAQTNKQKMQSYVADLKAKNPDLFAYSKGNFSVSESGAMVYEIPLLCVPGTAGMTPKISLIYNSNGGNGIMGEGWSLSGLSVISRTAKNIATDNENGRISFDDNDRLVLDGQRLINIEEDKPYWPNSSEREYRTELNSFKQIKAFYIGQEVKRIQVKTKDGLIYHFGAKTNEDTRTFYLRENKTSKKQIISWLLVRIEDLNNNQIDFEYDEAALEANKFIKPTFIRYTGFKNKTNSFFANVRFNYDRSDYSDNAFLTGKIKTEPCIKYINGQPIAFNEYLTSIVCEYNDDPNNLKKIRTYKIHYQESQNNRHKVNVDFVDECINNDDCIRTRFSWQKEDTVAVTTNQAEKFSSETKLTEDHQLYTGDFNGDGLPDQVAIRIFKDSVSFDFRKNNKGEFKKVKHYCIKIKPGAFSRLLLNDFDSNGTTDIAFCWNTADTIFNQIVWLPQQLDGGKIQKPFASEIKFKKADSNIPSNAIFYSSNDFNGDGLQDIYAYYYTKESIKVHFALNSLNKGCQFVKTAQNIPLVVQSDTIPENVPVNLGDYNGDGISDLLFSWVKKNEWKTVTYLLNKEIANGTQAFNNPINKNNGRAQQNTNETVQFNEITFGKTKYRKDSVEIDVDSILSISKRSFQTFLSKNFTATKSVYTPDLNHDGNTDLLISNQNEEGWVIWVVTGRGDGTFNEPVKSEIDKYAYPYMYTHSFGDFNGDGNIDLATTHSGSKGWYCKIAYGNGNGKFSGRKQDFVRLSEENYTCSSKQPSIGLFYKLEDFIKGNGEVCKKQLVNFNNGKDVPDNIVKNIDRCIEYFSDKMWKNKVVPTSSFGSGGEDYFENFVFTDAQKKVSDEALVFKRVESISLIENGSAKTIQRNYDCETNAECIITSVSNRGNANKNYQEFMHVKFADYWKPIIADLNGDGVTDFALSYPVQPTSEINGFSSPALEGAWNIFISLNKAKKSGKISEIKWANDATIQILYANTTETGTFDCDTLPVQYPFAPYNVPVAVVKKTLSPNGTGTFNVNEYDYKNGIISLQGRGFLGFQKSEVNASATKTHTQRIMLADTAFLKYGLMPLATIESYVNTALVNTEQLKNSLFYDFNKKVIFSFVKERETKQYDLNGKLTSGNKSLSDYDAFGNLVYNKTTFEGGKMEIISNQYLETSTTEEQAEAKNNFLNRWIIGRLYRTTVTKAFTGSPEIKRIAEFEYDNTNGQIRLEKSLVNTRYEIHKRFFYDLRGNKIKEIAYPALDISDTTVTSYYYDKSKHKRFITEKKDALGYTVKYEPDEVYGINKLTTDANGNSTKIPLNEKKYDPFGRFRKVIYPDNNWGEEKTYRCKSCDVENAVYFKISENSSANSPVISFFDVLDREIKKISFNIDYKRVAWQNFYNEKGQLVKTTEAYFDEDALISPPAYTLSEYDELGRTTKVIHPDKTVNTMQYDGTKIISTNPKGQKNSIINDLMGRKIMEINNIADTVRFSYDADGNACQITDQSGRKFVSEFDKDLGKQTYGLNPNTGYPTTYEYNYWGELSRIKSGPKSLNSVDLQYDKLGRLVQRLENEFKFIASDSIKAPENKRQDKITYLYITADDNLLSGKGKLKEVIVSGDERSMNKSFAYDKYGRVVKKKYSLKTLEQGDDLLIRQHWNKAAGTGKSIDIGYTYNQNGQIESIRYPKIAGVSYNGDFVVKYAYENGQLKYASVDEKKIWEAKEANADGTLSSVAMNEGNTITNYAYNSLNKNLERISTRYKETMVQDWNYEYDEIANTTYRCEKINQPNRPEKFEFDALNRVKTTFSDTSRTEYSYDEIGNFSYRSDLGYFKYDQKNKKLIINAAKETHLKDDEGKTGDKDDMEYYHDDIGNRFMKETKEVVNLKIKYTHFNKPDEITSKGITTKFYYDESNNLMAEQTGSTAKFYLDGLFEFETKTFTNTTTNTQFTQVNNQKFFITVNNHLIAYNNIERMQKSNYLCYLHKDALGSVTAITDSTGKPKYFSFDIWGKRVNPVTGLTSSETGFTRGFTSHQHWDNYDLVNMGGRIFDPLVGQFLQVDPVLNLEIPAMGLSAYSYCYQNPLYYTDPTGYFSLKGALKSVGDGLSSIIRDPGRALVRGMIGAPIFGPGSLLISNMPGISDFIDKNAGTIVAIEVSVAMMALGVPPVASGFASGFSSGFAQTYLNGGSFGQAFEAGLVSGTISGVTAGICAGIGEVFMGSEAGSGLFGNNYWANYTGKAVTTAAFQGAMNEAQGGNFADGAIPALLTSAGDPLSRSIGGTGTGSSVARTMISATIGGTASELGGGKFANGAVTSAATHLYSFEMQYQSSSSNYRTLASEKKNCLDEQEPIETSVSFGQTFANAGADGGGGASVPLGPYASAGASVDKNGCPTFSMGVGPSVPGIISGTVGINVGTKTGIYLQGCYFGVCGQVDFNGRYNPPPADRLPIGPKY